MLQESAQWCKFSVLWYEYCMSLQASDTSLDYICVSWDGMFCKWQSLSSFNCLMSPSHNSLVQILYALSACFLSLIPLFSCFTLWYLAIYQFLVWKPHQSYVPIYYAQVFINVTDGCRFLIHMTLINISMWHSIHWWNSVRKLLSRAVVIVSLQSTLKPWPNVIVIWGKMEKQYGFHSSSM